jgi:hypothetical protein
MAHPRFAGARRPAATLAAACLALAALPAAQAEPAAALQPMAFLAGHCWKGTFPDGQRTDEHCFAWLLGGNALRDTHTVRTPGRPDYVGDTTYFVDPVARRVDYVYVENQGGVLRGSMTPEAGALVFPEAVYADADGPVTLRARWTLQGADAYEAWNEAKVKEGWKTLARVVMRRQP